MKPSDFSKVKPWSSVKGTSEHETVARNVMSILDRTGDEWREMSVEEYENERRKGGNWSEIEKRYFEEVSGFCVSEQTARLFSTFWEEL